MRTTEDATDPICELISTEQHLGLCDLAFAMNPLGLDCIEPRALGRQKARHYPHPSFATTVFDLAVVGADRASDLMALVPGGIVPDQKQGLLAPLLEPVAAPREELRGYGAHRPTIHEPKPSLSELRQIKPVAGEGLRLRIILSRSPFFGHTPDRGSPSSVWPSASAPPASRASPGWSRH